MLILAMDTDMNGDFVRAAYDVIALVRSPFKEKFGIPRQPNLIRRAQGVVELLPPYASPDSVRGLEQFSHLWLLFEFHATAGQGWQPLVRPPRLGGNKKVGVFASRSTHRPNPVGMSVVRLERVDVENGVRLHVSGLDLLDQTPILDIKPYLPYADVIADARGGYAENSPAALLEVVFSDMASQFCRDYNRRTGYDLQGLIQELIELDPRPAYQNEPGRRYGVKLAEFDVQWVMDGNVARVEALIPLGQSGVME